MRTLTSTLTNNQKSTFVNPLLKVVLTSGVTTHTWYGARLTSSADNRVLKVDHDEDSAWSQKATITLANDDKVVSALTLFGYKVVISYGANDPSAGDEYSASAPLWVINQKEESLENGRLTVKLTCEGTPNLIARDKAIDYYMPSENDTKTCKTLISSVMAATSPHTAWATGATYAVNDVVSGVSNGKAFKCTTAGTAGVGEPTWDTAIGAETVDNTVTWECTGGNNPFSGCTAYTVTYDSEDALIDAYIPKDGFRIYYGQSRLAVLRKLLEWTGCVARFEDDGELHIMVPVTSGTEWASPTGNVDGGSVWNDETLAYDGDTATIAYANISRNTWTDYLELTHSSIYCDKLRVWADVTSTSTSEKISVDVYYNAGWHNLYEDIITESQWVEYSLGAKYNVTAMRIRFWRANDGGITGNGRIMEAAFHLADYYAYSLVAGDHNFFSKAYLKSLVIPNKVIVSSQSDDATQYTGNYTDATSFALLPVTYPMQAALESDAQGTAIATAIIGKLQLASQQGSGYVPMNVGQEVHDYVLITDSRAGDTRYGNIGWIHRRYNVLVREPGKQWGMTFGFGKPEIGQKIDELLNDIAAFASEGDIIPRLAVKDLFVENIHADSLTLVTVDDIADGTTYQRVKSTAVDANGMVILDQVTTGTYGLVLATDITAGHIKLSEASGTLDDIDNGTYGKVLTTDISAGHILLSSVEQSATYRTTNDTEKSTWNGKPDDMDEIGEGSTYGRVKQTIIAAGLIQVGTGTKDSTLSGWNIDASEIVGQASGADKVVMTTGGKIQIVGETSILEFIYSTYSNAIYATSGGDLGFYPYLDVRVNGDVKPSNGSSYDIGGSAAGNLWDYIYGNYFVATNHYKVGSNQVVGARVVDARCDDNINSGDATTDGVIDALRDAMIAHGLIAAA